MKKTSFRYEGIDFPIRFITVHASEESFVKDGMKQFFPEVPEAQRQIMLKEIYKQGKDIADAANTAATTAKPAKEIAKPAADAKAASEAK